MTVALTVSFKLISFFNIFTNSPVYTVDKNGVHLKITTFSCIKFKKKYISQLFFLKILRSFYANEQ